MKLDLSVILFVQFKLFIIFIIVFAITSWLFYINQPFNFLIKVKTNHQCEL